MQSEIIVLASCFKNIIAFEQAKGSLTPLHFLNPHHSRLFALIREFKEPPELYALSERCGLEARLTAEIDGSRTYVEGALEHHIEIVKENFRKKSLHSCARHIVENLKSKTSFELQNDLQSILGESFSNDLKPSQALSNVWAKFGDGKDYLDHLDKLYQANKNGEYALNGIPSFYPQLDNLIGCFHKSSLTLIGASTHTGKTTFALSVAMNILKNDKDACVHFVSLEMPSERLLERFVAQRCCIYVKNLMTGNISAEERHRVFTTAEEIKGYKLIFEDTFSISISALSARIKSVKEQYGTSIVFIDYLTKISPDRYFNNRHLEIDNISKGIQKLASDINIPLVCLAQFNRGACRDGNSPNLSDFRESGSIEEDADTCILLHRPDRYDKYKKPGILEVYVAKNRIMLDLGLVEFMFSDGRLIEAPKISQQIKEAHEGFTHFS